MLFSRSFSSLISQCGKRRTNIILFHLKWGSTYFFFFFLSYPKLVNKMPLAKTLNYSFCKRLLNLAVFKCSGRSVSDFSRRSLNHKGLEWVTQMARVLMAIFFKGDLFSPLAFFCPFHSEFFFIVFLPCERDTVSYFTRSNYWWHVMLIEQRTSQMGHSKERT